MFLPFAIKLAFVYYFVLNIILKGLLLGRDLGFEAVTQMWTMMAW